MTSIKQQDDLSISEDGAVQKLAEKDSARLIVVSDSHGSTNIIISIIKRFGYNADALCFCGDGIRDLLDSIKNYSADSWLMKLLPNVIMFVRGNNDNSHYNMITDKHIEIKVPVEQIFTAASKRIYITHGHSHDVYYGTKQLVTTATEKNANLVFYGHTHISNLQHKHGITILNPGSCSLPRSGLPLTFAVVDLKKDSDKAECSYYEIGWNQNGDLEFIPYNPSTKEINLLW